MTDDELRQILSRHLEWLAAGSPGGDPRRADLSGMNLRGSRLLGADLREADLSGMNLSGSRLLGTDLREADLSGTNLSDAYIVDASLRGARLLGARLSDANLRETTGIMYASISAPWHGEIGRQLLAVDHGEEEGVVVHCGCFRGSFDALAVYIEAGDPDHAPSRRRAAKMLREMMKDS